MKIIPGLAATASLTVADTDTAIACRSGDVTFLVTAEDSSGTVATGRVVRALVNREIFLAAPADLTPSSTNAGRRPRGR